MSSTTDDRATNRGVARKRGKKRRTLRNRGHHASFNKGTWSKEEKRLFLQGLRQFGKGKWKKIGTILTTRSIIQIKSHGQKVLTKMEAPSNGDDDLSIISISSTTTTDYREVSESEDEEFDNQDDTYLVPGSPHPSTQDHGIHPDGKTARLLRLSRITPVNLFGTSVKATCSNTTATLPSECSCSNSTNLFNNPGVPDDMDRMAALALCELSQLRATTENTTSTTT